MRFSVSLESLFVYDNRLYDFFCFFPSKSQNAPLGRAGAHPKGRGRMAIGILNDMARKPNGFFLEEAPCGSTGFFTRGEEKEFL
jgi:hypothetical protein